MERKRKIRRGFFLAFSIYFIINIFIFGLMKAYLNTSNMVKRDHLVMMEVSQNTEKTEIQVLGKNFVINKNDNIEKIAETIIYFVMPYKLRACTDIVMQCEDKIKQ